MDDFLYIKGKKFIRDERLTGERIAEMTEDTKEFRVSPAVFELLKTEPDREAVLQKLTYQEKQVIHNTNGGAS